MGELKSVATLLNHSNEGCAGPRITATVPSVDGQLMSGFCRVVIGSVVGGLLGTASFFAVDSLITPVAKAESQAIEDQPEDAHLVLTSGGRLQI